MSRVYPNGTLHSDEEWDYGDYLYQKRKEEELDELHQMRQEDSGEGQSSS